MALSEVGVGVVGADGLAELSDVVGCGAWSLATGLAFSIVSPRAVRTNSNAIPRNRICE